LNLNLTMVTIILPAHNAEDTLADAIRSCLDQTYDHYELWVLENGSTDKTVEIAKQFEGEKVKVFSLGKTGFQGALTWGLENATTKYIARMDADDIMMRHRLEWQVNFLENTEGAIMIGTHCAYLTPFGSIIERKPGKPDRQLKIEHFNTANQPIRKYFGDPTVMFDRQAAIEAGGYDDEFTIGDIPLWIRMLKVGKCFENNEIPFIYRLKPASMSQGYKPFLDSINIRKKYAPEQLVDWPSEVPKGYQSKDNFNFWRRIAEFALLTDSKKEVRKALDKMMQEPVGLKKKIKSLIGFRFMPGFKKRIQRKHNNLEFVRRHDLEEAYKEYL